MRINKNICGSERMLFENLSSGDVFIHNYAKLIKVESITTIDKTIVNAIDNFGVHCFISSGEYCKLVEAELVELLPTYGLIINRLCFVLNVDIPGLIALMRISKKTFNVWRNSIKHADSNTPIACLWAAVNEIRNLMPDTNGDEIKLILQNGDVELENKAWEDIDCLPLISYLMINNIEPHEIINVVTEAIDNYNNYVASL